MVKKSELKRGRQQELVFHLSKNGLDNAMLSIWGLQKHQTTHLSQGSGTPLDCMVRAISWFINSFNNYLLKVYCVQDTARYWGCNSKQMQTRFLQRRRLTPPLISSIGEKFMFQDH